MAAPVALRAQYSHLYGVDMLPVLEELFQWEMEQHPSRREMLFKVVAHDRDIWQATSTHDLPLFAEIPEGSEYSFHRSKQGAAKTLSMVKFGLGFSISEEMVDDAKFDPIADMVRKLARSAKESQEIQAMAVFNNGFSTELTADGVSVFNAAHPLPSGGTFSNLLSVAADLSSVALDTALAAFETTFVGDGGIIYDRKPRVLLVRPELWRYALELTGSDLKADTADNNMNSFKQDGLMVVKSPHLTDADAWFLLDAPGETGLRIISRNPIETKAAGADVGFLNDSIFYKARYRERIGVTEAVGVFGTPGA